MPTQKPKLTTYYNLTESSSPAPPNPPAAANPRVVNDAGDMRVVNTSGDQRVVD